MKTIESGVGFNHVLSDFGKQVSLKSITNGIVYAIFVGSFLIFFWSTAPKFGIDTSVIDTWITADLYVMAIGSILMAAYFRKPIGMAGSFTGTIACMSVAHIYTLSEIWAGCLASGILLVLLAVSGLMGKVLKFLPAPVVMGMIAGAFLKYGLFIVEPLGTSPVIVVLMVVSYLLASKYSRRIPGVLAALIVAVIYYLVVGVDVPPVSISVIGPRFFVPAFTARFPSVFISVSIPLTALVLGAENAQAYGVLKVEEYDPPINAMTLYSGIGGILVPFLGGINVNVAGPATAIAVSPDSGKKEGRWTTVVIASIIILAYTPFYASLVNSLMSFPMVLANLIAGLSVLGVLVGSLRTAFSDPKYKLSGVFAFLIAASGFKMFGLTAAFWALLIGDLIYVFIEGGLKSQKVAVKNG